MMFCNLPYNISKPLLPNKICFNRLNFYTTEPPAPNVGLHTKFCISKENSRLEE